MIKLFRCIVIGTMTLNIAYWCVPELLYQIQTEEQRVLTSWDTYGAVLDAPEWFYWAYLIGWLLLLSGLLLHIRLARVLFLIALGGELVLVTLFGYRVFSPADLVIGNMLLLANGATLVIVHFTSVSQHFNESKI